ncbi:MAG: DUF5928 domain-containing protein [Pseudomonadota bacterium]
MAKIAFLLMVHKDPERVIHQARALTTHGDCVAIHVDANMPAPAARAIREGLATEERITFARRLRCGWGEWSLVAASLNLLRAARREFDGITHYFLISGDCCPTKSRSFLDGFLDREMDHIEAHDFFDTNWIRTGLREDRLIYRHWFNERKRKGLFYTSLNAQRWLGMSRTTPEGIRVHIGSQWWVLRASTVERIEKLLSVRRDLIRFFRTTWIPDETFFQTLVAQLVPRDQISGEPPTSLLFSDYGMPVVFHADHDAYLRSQPQPFARKISSHDADFQRRLFERFGSWDADLPEGGPKTGLYGYLAGRGRTGQRYAQRFWQQAISPREDAEVLIVASKIWHLGTQAAEIAGHVTQTPAFGYVFDEDVDLPLSLGNLESGLYKRNEHRQALMNLVLDAVEGKRLILCVDPGRREVIEDLARFAGTVRIMLLERVLGEAHLVGHAERVALVHANSGLFERAEACKALEAEFHMATRDLRARFRGSIFINDLSRSRDDNATDIGHFLHLPRAHADHVAREYERLIQ